jgi:hypothetical protein
LGKLRRGVEARGAVLISLLPISRLPRRVLVPARRRSRPRSCSKPFRALLQDYGDVAPDSLPFGEVSLRDEPAGHTKNRNPLRCSYFVAAAEPSAAVEYCPNMGQQIRRKVKEKEGSRERSERRRAGSLAPFGALSYSVLKMYSHLNILTRRLSPAPEHTFL